MPYNTNMEKRVAVLTTLTAVAAALCAACTPHMTQEGIVSAAATQTAKDLNCTVYLTDDKLDICTTKKDEKMPILMKFKMSPKALL